MSEIAVKFKLGDKAWYSTLDTREKHIPCPECFGKLFLTVILGDNSQVTVDCMGCAPGLEYPRGFVIEYEAFPNVREVTITQIEMEEHVVRYGFNGCYRTDEENLYPDEESAQVRAKELVANHTIEEQRRMLRKERETKNWSWHVHYHRDCVRRAEKELIYHSAKLAVAKTHAKSEE